MMTFSAWIQDRSRPNREGQLSEEMLEESNAETTAEEADSTRAFDTAVIPKKDSAITLGVDLVEC